MNRYIKMVRQLNERIRGLYRSWENARLYLDKRKGVTLDISAVAKYKAIYMSHQNYWDKIPTRLMRVILAHECGHLYFKNKYNKYHNRRVYHNRELMADKFAAQLGYKEDLIEAINWFCVCKETKTHPHPSVRVKRLKEV